MAKDWESKVRDWLDDLPLDEREVVLKEADFNLWPPDAQQKARQADLAYMWVNPTVSRGGGPFLREEVRAVLETIRADT